MIENLTIAFRYECGGIHWLRRSFKIFSPHWGMCLWVKGGQDPEFVFPNSQHILGNSEMELMMDSKCDGFETQRNLWSWHWSFHLRNPLTDTCLTAAAFPSMKVEMLYGWRGFVLY